MTSPAEYFYLFIGGAMSMLVVLGLILAFITPGIDQWSRHFFSILFSILVLYIFVCLAELFLYGKPDMIPVDRFLLFVESILFSITILMFTAYLLHCCGENWQKSLLFLTNATLLTIYFILLLLAQFTTFIYYVSPDYQFYRGPWYPLVLLPLDGIIFLNLTALIRRRKKISRVYFAAFLTHLLPIAFTGLIYTFIEMDLLLVIGETLSIFPMYIIILLDQNRQYLHQQVEIASQEKRIAHQRASIMVLQMRPHFIFNTMMVLHALCDQNPSKAKQVMEDFISYLRRNFNAIASDHTIPFSEELEHTRAYLSIEQAKYEDNLLIDFDTPCTQFRVPPLTLQPVVENAVKHGMDPDAAPLRITIRTCETNRGSDIIVEDTGVGFRSPDDEDPHIALTNIRQRLEMMCNGKLTIMPREGGGTIVTITIPELPKQKVE